MTANNAMFFNHTRSVNNRIDSLDWQHITEEISARGNAVLSNLLNVNECRGLINLYADMHHFRSRIVMQRYNFGQGEYRYFNYPLPDIVADLRTYFYPHLATLANRWNKAMKMDARFPPAHSGFLERCHAADQTRPTPLLLRYGPGDYNCLHQDLYGEHVFPLQVTVLLSVPAVDFSGGEFVLAEQRPRMQSRVEVVPLQQGDAVIFAVNQRPVAGKRGYYRVNMRHGVSRLRAGKRYSLGVIFHDAA